MRQTVEKKAEPNGARPTKKPRNLPLLEVDIPQAGQRPTLEIRSDCKTMVDWINGRAKLKTSECTVEKTQNFLRDWWGRGVHQRQRTTGARRDAWKKGCTLPMSCGPRSLLSVGFGDGSCDNGNCGAGITIMACSEILGWFPFNKKCGPVSCQNSLYVDLAVVVC